MRIIFVFGSNRQGIHGAGAALEARQRYGAILGQPEGLQGDSYAIVTKELRPDQPPVTLEEVQRGVTNFLNFARAHPELWFYVTPVGTGLAGFTMDQIAPMFESALPMENVYLTGIFLNWFNANLDWFNDNLEAQ